MKNCDLSSSDLVPIGSLVNARFKRNFHDCVVLDVDVKFNCKVGYYKRSIYYTTTVDSSDVKGNLAIGSEVLCNVNGRERTVTIKNIHDVSTYKLDFFDGDIAYVQRRKLTVKKLASKELDIQKYYEELNAPKKRNTLNSLRSTDFSEDVVSFNPKAKPFFKDEPLVDNCENNDSNLYNCDKKDNRLTNIYSESLLMSDKESCSHGEQVEKLKDNAGISETLKDENLISVVSENDVETASACKEEIKDNKEEYISDVTHSLSGTNACTITTDNTSEKYDDIQNVKFEISNVSEDSSDEEVCIETENLDLSNKKDHLKMQNIACNNFNDCENVKKDLLNENVLEITVNHSKELQNEYNNCIEKDIHTNKPKNNTAELQKSAGLLNITEFENTAELFAGEKIEPSYRKESMLLIPESVKTDKTDRHARPSSAQKMSSDNKPARRFDFSDDTNFEVFVANSKSKDEFGFVENSVRGSFSDETFEASHIGFMLDKSANFSTSVVNQEVKSHDHSNDNIIYTSDVQSNEILSSENFLSKQTMEKKIAMCKRIFPEEFHNSEGVENHKVVEKHEGVENLEGFSKEKQKEDYMTSFESTSTDLLKTTLSEKSSLKTSETTVISKENVLEESLKNEQKSKQIHLSNSDLLKSEFIRDRADEDMHKSCDENLADDVSFKVKFDSEKVTIMNEKLKNFGLKLRKMLNRSVLLLNEDIPFRDFVEILHIELHSAVSGVAILKYPSIKDDSIDLYRLKQCVELLGGLDTVCKGKNWKSVAKMMKIENPTSATFCCLKRFHARWVEPYLIHLSVDSEKTCCKIVKKMLAYFRKSISSNDVVNIELIKNYLCSRKRKKDTDFSDLQNAVTDIDATSKSFETFDLSDKKEPSTSLKEDAANYDNDNSFSETKKKSNKDYAYHQKDDGNLCLGSIVYVKYGKNSYTCNYAAKVIKIRENKETFEYLVHYMGWNARHDEWIERCHIDFDKNPELHSVKNRRNSFEKLKDKSTGKFEDKDLQNNVLSVKKEEIDEPKNDEAIKNESKSFFINDNEMSNNDDDVIKRKPIKKKRSTSNNDNTVVFKPKFHNERVLKASSSSSRESSSPNFETPLKSINYTDPKSNIMVGLKNSRRTRNSLEDALLNAVLQKSVLETHHTPTATGDDGTEIEKKVIDTKVASMVAQLESAQLESGLYNKEKSNFDVKSTKRISRQTSANASVEHSHDSVLKTERKLSENLNVIDSNSQATSSVDSNSHFSDTSNSKSSEQSYNPNDKQVKSSASSRRTSISISGSHNQYSKEQFYTVETDIINGNEGDISSKSPCVSTNSCPKSLSSNFQTINVDDINVENISVEDIRNSDGQNNGIKMVASEIELEVNSNTISKLPESTEICEINRTSEVNKTPEINDEFEITETSKTDFLEKPAITTSVDENLSENLSVEKISNLCVRATRVVNTNQFSNSNESISENFIKETFSDLKSNVKEDHILKEDFLSSGEADNLNLKTERHKKKRKNSINDDYVVRNTDRVVKEKRPYNRKNDVRIEKIITTSPNIFTDEANIMVEKYFELDKGLTSEPSLENINKIENYMIELQRSYLKLRKEMRKIDRKRKRCLLAMQNTTKLS